MHAPKTDAASTDTATPATPAPSIVDTALAASMARNGMQRRRASNALVGCGTREVGGPLALVLVAGGVAHRAGAMHAIEHPTAAVHVPTEDGGLLVGEGGEVKDGRAVGHSGRPRRSRAVAVAVVAV